MSTRKIKVALRDIINNENKQKPLSDDALAKVMKEKGFPIARRTVAKYREQLNLPVCTSTQRISKPVRAVRYDKNMNEKNIILTARIASMLLTPFYLPCIGHIGYILFLGSKYVSVAIQGIANSNGLLVYGVHSNNTHSPL